MNKEKLLEVIESYKADFQKYWEKEKYKWEAVHHFQRHWDLHASNFSEMLERALEKTGNLLRTRNFFPKLMITTFAKRDPEFVRTMFMELYDESIDLKVRVETFINRADEFRTKHEGEWNLHYQNTNTVSIYLWLRFPDQYFIYKYSDFKAITNELECDYKPIRKNQVASMMESYELYNEVANTLQRDSEIKAMLGSVITEDCYSDPYLITLTIDFNYYLCHYYSIERSDWFPKDYHPEISVEQWIELLNDPEVFRMNSLEIMKRMKDFGEMATCTELANKYGKSSNFYNRGSSALAEPSYGTGF